MSNSFFIICTAFFLAGSILTFVITRKVYIRKSKNEIKKVHISESKQYNTVTKKLREENKELAAYSKDLHAATHYNSSIFLEWVSQALNKQANCSNDEQKYIEDKIDLVVSTRSDLIEQRLSNSFDQVLKHLNNHENAVTSFIEVKQAPAILKIKENTEVAEMFEKMVKARKNQVKIEEFFNNLKPETISQILSKIETTDVKVNAFTSLLFTAHTKYLETGSSDFSDYNADFESAIAFNDQLTSLYKETKQSFSTRNINIEKYHW